MAVGEVGPGGHLLTAWNLADLNNVTTALTNLGLIDANGNMVGQLIGRDLGPASNTSFSSMATAAGFNAAVADGSQYWIEGRVLGTQQTANGLTEFQLSTDDGIVNTVRFVSTTVTSGNEYAGGGGTLYVPTASRTTSFTLSVFTSGGTFLVGAGAAEIVAWRVA